MKNGILYFYKLIKGDEQNLARQILLQQIKTPMNKDWIVDVKNDLKEFGINAFSVNFFSIFSKVAAAFKY